MTLYDELKYLIGGYLGIRCMDSYDLKSYVLKDVENYIKDYMKTYSINKDFEEELSNVDKELSLTTKLQDALLVIPKVDAPLELTLMIERRLKEMEKEDNLL